MKPTHGESKQELDEEMPERGENHNHLPTLFVVHRQSRQGFVTSICCGWTQTDHGRTGQKKVSFPCHIFSVALLIEIYCCSNLKQTIPLCGEDFFFPSLE